jgi:Fur family transcriptional regulator, peroxide stress response regulator
MNGEEHHHMVCSECKKITDIDDSELGLKLEQRSLPGGFVARRYAVDVIGICAECQAKQN